MDRLVRRGGTYQIDTDVSMYSDNQRRLICRILFLLLACAPTCVVCYRICHPQTASQWQREIQSQLGIVTTIDSIETPGPYVTLLRGVKLSDHEIGPVFEATQVRLEFGETNRIIIPQKIRVTNQGILYLVQTINEHLIRSHAADRPWQVQFLDQIIVEESIHVQRTGSLFPQTLLAENLQIDIRPMIDGTVSQLRFQISPPDKEPTTDDQWITCSLSRSHVAHNQRSQQRLELDTRDTPIPCWLIGDLVPQINALGPECQFAGQVDVNPREGKPYGWFAGTFFNVHGESIPADSLGPGKNNYQARVELCSLDGGVEKLSAWLVRPDGTQAPIHETLAVVEQFDVGRALRSAAESDNFLHADTKFH